MLHLYETIGRDKTDLLISPPIVGERGTLGIILRSYDPVNIKCGTIAQRYSTDENCNRLLGVIPASVSPPTRWGPRGQSGVDKYLPSGWQIPGKYFLYSVCLVLPPLDTSLKGRLEE